MILRLQNINTYYGPSHILFDVSLEVGVGEVVVLLGRNGVGKTTTLRSIMGLTPPRTGRIEFKGEEVTHFPPYRLARSGLAFVPEDRRIFPEITVEDNLVVSQRACQTKKEDWTLKEIYRNFPFMEEKRNVLGMSLSGGQQQMLAIARGLISNPELLLLDEPTEGLAPLIVKEISALIARIKEKGISILLSEQNAQFALALAERGYILEKGRVRAQASGEELRQNSELQRKYLGVEKAR